MKDIQEILKEKISTYEFESLFDDSENGEVGKVREFKLSELSESDVIDLKTHEKKIRIERKTAKENAFNISPIVKEHRGIDRQEELEKERRIQDEVERRLVALEKEAFIKGYEEGKVVAHKEVFDQTRTATEEKLSSLSDIISEVLSRKHEMLSKERDSAHNLIRNLVKWITLKEIAQDDQYVVRLLAKLITELETKSNILVQIDEKSFENMPDILDHVKNVVGELKNVRLELDYDIDGPGIILESENGIINGTLKEQFKSLDLLFSHVGLEEEKNFVASEVLHELDNEEEINTVDEGEESDE